MKQTKFGIRLISMILCISMALSLCACSNDEKKQKQIFAMDTVMTLTAYGKNADAGLDGAAGIINSLDKMLDPDSEDSYTTLLNNAEGSDVVVTPQIAEMLSTALSVCKLSGGALDLSVYPIYEAWGEFSEETGRIPDSDELSQLIKNLRFSETELTAFEGEYNYSVRMPAGTQISFCLLYTSDAADE